MYQCISKTINLSCYVLSPQVVIIYQAEHASNTLSRFSSPVFLPLLTSYSVLSSPL